MKNKVLVKLYVPELDFETDLFLPVNEVLWKVKILIIKALSDMTGGCLDKNKKYLFINKHTGNIYKSNSILYDTDIRNATEIIIVSIK